MKPFLKCEDCIFPEEMNGSMIICCGENKMQHLKELQDKVARLESELKKQQVAAAKASKLLKLLHGDNFSTDSLF